MKLAERINIVTDILLAALHADKAMSGQEAKAARKLLADLLLTTPDALPGSLESHIADFQIDSFDLQGAAEEFLRDPPMKRRRLMELVVAMANADGVLDLKDDEFTRELGQALGMAIDEYADLVLDYEISDLRDSFRDLLKSTAPSERPADSSVPPPIPKAARLSDF